MLPLLGAIAAPIISKAAGDVASSALDKGEKSVGKHAASAGIKGAGDAVGKLAEALPEMQKNGHDMVSKVAGGLLGAAGSKSEGLM